MSLLLVGFSSRSWAGHRRGGAKQARPAKGTLKARATKQRQTKSRPNRSQQARGNSLRNFKTTKIQTKAATLPAAKTAKSKATTHKAELKRRGKKDKILKHRDKIREFQSEFTGDREQVLANQAADGHVASVMKHSERNGQYHIVSDLHWGKGRLKKKMGGDWDPREDFRKSQSFSKFVGQISKSKKGVSLVIGGDWLELMEHVDANAPLGEVKDQITKIVEGHAVETKALAKAVTDKGMRLVYLAGNHDVHLVDSRVRDHLVGELARVGGVPASKRARFGQRVAYSGHGAVLGRYGEGMVVHGHAQDASNNWRSVLNPYNAKRELQSNLGWNIVARLYRRIEAKNPEIDNLGKSSTKEVAKRVFSSPRHIASALSVVWTLLGGTSHFGKAGKLSERLDDRMTMRQWEKRTGFADKMSAAIPGAKPATQRSFARTIESIYRGTPQPLHEAMSTPSRTANLLVTFVRSVGMAKKIKNSEPTLLGRMTGELTNVRYVVWGHNHKEAVVTGKSAKGELGHYNTGTWTKVHGEWRLNVVSGRTNGDGRLKMDGVFRTEVASGKPNLPNKFDTAKARPVPGWNN